MSAQSRDDNGFSKEIVTLAWNKAENSKRELQRNWTYQMIVVAVSIGLVLDAGENLSVYFFGKSGQERIFYMVLPSLSFYLFIRLGALLTQFIEEREASNNLIKDNIGFHHLSRIFTTTSFFEIYYSRQVYSRGVFNTGIALYTFLIFAIVLSTGHICSIYFLIKLSTEFEWQLFYSLIYILPIVGLYGMFSWGFRYNKYTLWSIIFTLVVTIIGGIWLLPGQFSGGETPLFGAFHI